jgi:hypothetical protein
MIEKNRLFGMVLLLIFSFSFASCALKIEEEPVSVVAVKELNLPAIFKLKIINEGVGDSFNIYSLVGVVMEPTEQFYIAHGETKEIILKIYPTLKLKVSPDYYSIEYKLKGLKTGVQEEEIDYTVANLKDAVDISIDAFDPTSDKTYLRITNKAGHKFNLTVSAQSDFFSSKNEFELDEFGKEVLELKLNKDKMNSLLAGPYISKIKISSMEHSSDSSIIFSFSEKPGIETKEEKSGFFIRKHIIEKINKGNTRTEVYAESEIGLFSSLFTGTNPVAYEKEYLGVNVVYRFKKDISPSETFKIVVTTNWVILLGIIVAIVLIWKFVNKYILSRISLKKNVELVKTKGGEFALRVNIRVKAREFVDKIRIIDRLPSMVKIYEKYGAIAPTRIDERTRTIEWNIGSLGKGEERIINYIIYSKINIVGRFELPKAGALFEFRGNLEESDSNRSFYESSEVKSAS